MNKNFRFFGIALAGTVALLLPLKADAICGSGIAFGSYYANIQGTDNGPNFRANFWMLNGGNPNLGAGNDAGAISHTASTPTAAPWIQTYGGGIVVLGDWATLNYDGCADAVQPTSAQRMVFSFSDVDAGGNMLWAAACVLRIPSQSPQFDLGTVAGGEIPLVPATKAEIVNTVRTGNEAAITIKAPNFAAGLKSDGSATCDAASVIPQFDVYKQQTGRGVAPSATNDATGPWVFVQSCPSGVDCTITTTCGTTNCDNYLAVTPRFNSSFNTGEAATGAPARLSVRSGNVQAGPTLAVTPKPKNIKNERVGPKQMQQ